MSKEREWELETGILSYSKWEAHANFENQNLNSLITLDLTVSINIERKYITSAIKCLLSLV